MLAIYAKACIKDVLGFSHILRIPFPMEKDSIFFVGVSISEHMITLVASVTALYQGLQTQRSWDEIVPLSKMQTFGSLVTI